ncbi:RHOMBOID-like protein 6, mitochondrial isoform X1 [Physcomitrium patens]|uniref:RHOMBOID-like protein n=1 Tax=Physcomitrium patens TaxID=3218 RepID=A0A2K1J0W4_PHYPA|nr:hypothetical protein PHYPA_023065 [Physcomitrium patens]
MALHPQPSAPSYQSYHCRWQQSTLSTENVPPLFDYKSYQENRREPSFTDACGQWTVTAPIDRGHMDVPCIMNAHYGENSHDQMGMQHQYSSNHISSTNNRDNHYGSTSLRPAVGPPMYMAGGAYDNPLHKQQQTRVDSWSSATQQNSGVSSGEVQDQMHVPWISMAFTIAHTVILIVTMHQNDCPSHTQTACLNPSFHKFAMQPFDENPLLGPSAKTLLSLGALESDLITKSREGWRLLSAMWLHAGVLHIAGTASGMLLLGIPLERQLGFVKVGVVYILSGFLGSVISALMVHGRVSVGASGAFMGLLGATLSSIIVNWKSYRHRSRALMGVMFFTALNAVFGLMPLADNFMHIGGAVMGFLIGNLFFIKQNFRCWKSSMVYDRNDMLAKRKNIIILDIVWLLSIGALIAASTMGLFALFSGMEISNGCSWCQYLTCAPSKFWKCSGDRHLGCNLSSVGSGLRVTCASGQYFDYSTVRYANKLTSEIQGLCIKACV